MRSSTKSILSVVSIGLVAASYKFGIETSAAQNGQLSSLGDGIVPTEIVSTPSVEPSSLPSKSTGGTTPSAKPGSKPTSGSKPTPTKKPTGTTKPASSQPAATQPAVTPPVVPVIPPVAAPASVTKTGNAIRYNFGTFQVSVTKTNGAITAVNLLQASYTRVPQGTNNWLVQSAIASQGSSFGNISRATYTTTAFKTALDSALAKF